MEKRSGCRLVRLVIYGLAFLSLMSIQTVAQSPVGAWGFDDGSGIAAADASSNGHKATLSNGASWVTGKVGGAVSASAASKQYVSIPAIDLSSTKAVTVALWTKRSYSTSGGHTLFEATADFAQSTTGFALFPDDSVCQGIRAALNGDVGQTANCYRQPTSSTWHHLAVVYDKTQSAGSQVALYVDGVLQTPTRSLAASTNTNSFGKNSISIFSQGGATQFDSGSVDDLRIYSSALTASQIQQIYNFGKNQIGKDFMVSVNGAGSMTTPSFTASVSNELLVAFVASDGPSSSGQTATVSGGGLTWTLRQRSNHQKGTAEIWSANAPSAPFTATVTAVPAGGSYHGSLTVIGFTNSYGTGKAGWAGAASGACDVALAGVSAGSWVFAVGNDWDNPIGRTPNSGQVLVHQRVDTQIGDTYWLQSTGAPLTVSGTVDIHDSAPNSDEWNYAAIEIVSASSATQGTLTPAPASVNYGNVAVNTSASQKVTITNTGRKPVHVSGVSISGTGFSLAAVSTPFTLAAGASNTLTATFSPTVTGVASGSITVASNASKPILSVPLSGTGASAVGTLSASPVSVSYGNVTVNTSASKTVTITNTRGTSVTVSGVSISGTGFSLAAVSTPFTLAASASKTLTATFSPTVTGAASGSITVASNPGNPSLSVPLGGTGASALGTLSASPASVSYGSVTVNTSASQKVTITNTGGKPVHVSGVSISGTGFSLAAVSTPFMLAAGTSKTLTATFSPAVTGAANGSITVASNASNPSLSVPLSGTGVSAAPHSVTLSWTASVSTVAGYNVYRSTSSSGPFSMLDVVLVASTTFVDTTVVSGMTYYYYATSVDSSGRESVPSTQVSATVP